MRNKEHLNQQDQENTWDMTPPTPPESSEPEKPETLDVSRINAALSEYLEQDGPDQVHNITERSPDATPFLPVNIRKTESEQSPTARAVYIVPGLMTGGNEESYGDLSRRIDAELQADTYVLDRSNDFSAKHALNGVLENLSGSNYESATIIAISVGASIGKAFDEHFGQLPEQNKDNLKIVYVDPYDKDSFAIGGSSADSLGARAARPLLCGLAAATRAAALLVGNTPIAEKARAVVDETGNYESLLFTMQQFGALGNTRIYNGSDELYAKDAISGIVVSGDKTADAANRDEFLDNAARLRNTGDIPIFEKNSTHGMTDDATVEKKGGLDQAKMSPEDAIMAALGRSFAE